MKILKSVLIKFAFTLLFFVSFFAQAQVGIGTLTPDQSAILDMASTTKG